MTFTDVPGFASVSEDRGETTLVVETAQLREAALYLRDERGFNFLSDIVATDYLGWNDRTVAGYWGHRGGRDINLPGSWGLAKKPEPKAKRFSVSYQLLAVVSGARVAPRVRLQVMERHRGDREVHRPRADRQGERIAAHEADLGVLAHHLRRDLRVGR